MTEYTEYKRMNCNKVIIVKSSITKLDGRACRYCGGPTAPQLVLLEYMAKGKDMTAYSNSERR